MVQFSSFIIKLYFLEFTMLQLSKIIKSRNLWKDKAIVRANVLREARKTQKRYQRKIAELKQENKRLQEEIREKKTPKSMSF